MLTLPQRSPSSPYPSRKISCVWKDPPVSAFLALTEIAELELMRTPAVTL